MISLLKVAGHPIRILIVEDEILLLLDLKQSLAERGAEIVAETGSGETAIKLARQHRPDVAIMDIVLEGRMDGVVAAREMIARFGTAVVFVSANADQTTRTRIDALSGPELIPKPAHPDAVSTAILRALGRRPSALGR